MTNEIEEEEDDRPIMISLDIVCILHVKSNFLDMNMYIARKPIFY